MIATCIKLDKYLTVGKEYKIVYPLNPNSLILVITNDNGKELAYCKSYFLIQDKTNSTDWLTSKADEITKVVADYWQQKSEPIEPVATQSPKIVTCIRKGLGLTVGKDYEVQEEKRHSYLIRNYYGDSLYYLFDYFAPKHQPKKALCLKTYLYYCVTKDGVYDVVNVNEKNDTITVINNFNKEYAYPMDLFKILD